MGDAQPQAWQQEILARHRWGQHGFDRAQAELSRMQPLWNAIQPVADSTSQIIDQIIALEICNWNLEKSILDLCAAIGTGIPVNRDVGHLASVTEERSKVIWAYYLAARDWLPCAGKGEYVHLLAACDPDSMIQRHVSGLLGQSTELKEFYVERFCLCLEMWLGGALTQGSASAIAHEAAVRRIEEEIKKRDPGSGILDALRNDGDGRLQPCNHKAIRRYDIILSSIGCAKWRGAMPQRGTDGLERADTLAKYLDPIQTWIERPQQATSDAKATHSLGTPDALKTFLASLLVSILRAQEIAARNRAKGRSGKPNNPTGGDVQ